MKTKGPRTPRPIVSISLWSHNTDHILCGELPPHLESLPPPQQLLHFSRNNTASQTHACIYTQQTHIPPTQSNTNEGTLFPHLPWACRGVGIIFSAPKTGTWLLPLVILMSTPGSPLLVTPANGMATSHANMPPHRDPLIPAIWLGKHGTTHAHSPRLKRKLSSFYPYWLRHWWKLSLHRCYILY